MTAYLLDTNIVSYFLRARHPGLIGRIESQSPQSLAVSAVTEGELLFGLERVGLPAKLTAATKAFLSTIEVLAWDRAAAASYAKLKSVTQADGVGISALDLMIAGQALAADATLVTNDGALKRLMPWLPVEDWTEA